MNRKQKIIHTLHPQFPFTFIINLSRDHRRMKEKNIMPLLKILLFLRTNMSNKGGIIDNVPDNATKKTD